MQLAENDDDDLDITVRRYVEVTSCPGFTDGELRRFQLPEGFPFLVNRRSGQIVEPVFRYLYDRVRGYAWGQKRLISLGSAAAAADNLRLWFGYLNYRGKQWNVVTALDIRAYADGLARLVSPRTGEFLAEGTIAQRRTHVVEFYRWANARGEVRIDARNLASVEASAGGSPAAPQPRGFTYEEWGRLRTSIGPLPSAPAYDPCTPEKAPCRDRLMCELAVHTGMRRHEICALTVYQIRALEAKLPPEAAGQEFSAKGLWLTVVKGGPRRARDAIVPVWLIRELLLYADGSERSRAAQVCARKNRGREPAELFLNHAWARHNPGKPFSAKRLTARFAELLVHAGFVERPNPSGTSVEKVSATERPTHSVHDLRHTAAVWRYMVERENGNPDPWKPVQVMLGHAHKETTIKIYLQITNTFEAEVSDRALRFFRGIAEAAPYNQVIS